MTNEEARGVLGDVRAYLASRASLENEMLAGHTFTDICNAIKALEPKPMEKFDDVKTHIQRLAGDYKCWDNRLTWEEALELNRMLEAQPCEDCISREEVQDLISRWLSDYLLDETREALETINYKVGDMPSVTPQRPKGKWMECGGDEPWLKGYCCSLCNFTTTNKYNYCPDCGAEMGGADETN